MQLQGWSNLSLQTLETICMVQRHQSSSSSSHHCIKSVINWVVPEKIRTPPTDGILEIIAGRGGGQRPGKPRREGGGNFDLHALPAFLPSVTSFFYPK